MPRQSGSNAATIRAFTSIQIERLTGITQRQLAYWERTDIYQATYVDERPYRPYRRIYSFRDLVSLKTLALLRNTHHVALSELRAVGSYLRQYSDSPWSELQFRVASDRRVIFRDPETRLWMTHEGQTAATILVDDIRKEAESQSDQLLERDPRDIGEITRHRHVGHNQWMIKGTRIPTKAIWNFHEAGYSTGEIIRQYPRLHPADIDRAIVLESELRDVA